MSNYIMDLRAIVGHRPLLQVGASVIVEDSEGRILLQLRSDNHCWGYAGGSVELDEVVEEAAKRELLEETGLTANKLELFGVFSGKDTHYIYPNGDEVSNIDIVYLCKDYSGTLTCQEGEVEKLKFFKIEEIPDNISPPIQKCVEKWIESKGKIRRLRMMDAKKILFIYNPKSGKAKIRNHLLDIIDVFANAGYLVTAYPTKYQGDAIAAVRDRGKGNFDLVVCSGGDGTLDEVVTGMMQSEEKLPIGYIPAGSTNDFAKNLGISNNMVDAARSIVEGKGFLCDIGKFNGDAFVYIAAFGLFTEVSYATEQNLKNALGHTAYILEGVKSLSSVKTYKMKFESEELCTEGEFIYGMISNSTSVGGFKNITAKDIELDDGKFEVTLVKVPSNLAELNNIGMSLVTRKFDSECVFCFKTSKLRIESEGEVSWTLDGEFGGNHKLVEVTNEHKALEFIINQE